jgi:hypothetical protein
MRVVAKAARVADFAERSIRHECLDHVIIRGEAHLRRILRSYAMYYGLWTKMRRFGGRFSGPESSLQIRSLADFITTTSESSFRYTHGLYRLAPTLNALAIAKPETVIKWHHAGFRSYWSSRRRWWPAGQSNGHH